MRLRYVEGFLRWLEKERRSEGSVRERRTKWWKEQGEEDTTVVENRGARRQGGKYKTAPPARVSTVVVERTRRTRHFFERKLQALLRGLFFTYFGFLFLFVTSSCKIFNNRYIVLRVIVCYYRKKSERSIVQRKTREAYCRKKKEGETRERIRNQENKRGRYCTDNRKRICIGLCHVHRRVSYFHPFFFALLSFIRARSVARRNQPVFSASVCLPQSISGS